MVEFLNVVKYHEAEGKSVKKIQKLIGRKVLVSRQLQASYELILQELSSFETITKT
jgi:transposase